MNAANEMQPVCSGPKGLSGSYTAGSTREGDALRPYQSSQFHVRKLRFNSAQMTTCNASYDQAVMIAPTRPKPPNVDLSKFTSDQGQVAARVPG